MTEVAFSMIDMESFSFPLFSSLFLLPSLSHPV